MASAMPPSCKFDSGPAGQRCIRPLTRAHFVDNVGSAVRAPVSILDLLEASMFSPLRRILSINALPTCPDFDDGRIRRAAALHRNNTVRYDLARRQQPNGLAAK
jgi:hypothetical protein